MTARRALATVAAWAAIAALGAFVAVPPAGAETAPSVKPPRKTKQKEPTPPPPAPPQPQAVAPTQPGIVFSPWTKLCPKPPPNAPQPFKPVCITVKEARLETGQFIAGAALFEQAGEDKRLLRITLPLGIQIPPGTRVTVDADQPLSAPFVTCVPNGCMADYQVDLAFIDKLKKAQQLLLQGVNMQGQVAGYLIPLTEFAKAIDGPPTDAEQFEAAQKKEWEERLRQQQQKLQQQQQQQAAPKQ